MKTRWRIQGTLTTTSPLHIGSGDVTTYDHPHMKGKDGNLNDVQAVVRDHDDQPCIPGTALKGVLRAWAQAMLPTKQAMIDQIFGSKEIKKKGDIDNKDLRAGWADFCTAFVFKPNDSQLERFKKHVPFWKAESLTGVMSHVCIDRHTGTAANNKLFYEEFVPEGITFQVEINATRLTEESIALLLAILEKGGSAPALPSQSGANSTDGSERDVVHCLPYQFGANGANGWGRMSWNRSSVTQFDTSIREDISSAVGFKSCTKDVADQIQPDNISPQVPQHLSAALTLTMQGPFLVNDASRTDRDEMSNEEKREIPHFVPLQCPTGDIWLPASSFRGALRERAEFLLRSLNPNATGDPNGLLGDGPIERIFGTTSQASRLVIEEFCETNESKAKKDKTCRQDFVAIDRFTGGAAQGAKFDAIYADSPQFQTNLTLLLDGLKPEDVALLRVALHDVCTGKVTLGWGGSKGYGEASGKLTSRSNHDVPKEWGMPSSMFAGDCENDCVDWLKIQLNTLFDINTAGSPTEAALRQQQEPLPELSRPATYEGTLTVTAKSQRIGEWNYILYFTKKNGKEGQISITNSDVLSDDLRNKPSERVPVDFEEEGGKRVRIRPCGEEWVRAPATEDFSENSATADEKNTSFANPYYFLRMKDRKSFKGTLADRRPVGHSRYCAGLYSGQLRVKLTTQSPLLICGEEAVEPAEGDRNNGHKTYELRTDIDDKPLLASSSVRGMLRAAYEAITNSRFGVFPFKPQADELSKQANARRLGYRMTVEEGLGLVPVRIENGQAYLMLGGNPNLPTLQGNGKWRVQGTLYAAWVPQYQKDVPGYTAASITINGNPPIHGQKAWCWLEKIKRSTPHFSFFYWRVREAAMEESDLASSEPDASRSKGKYSSEKEFKKVQGVFVISNQNIKNKHDERFFFEESEISADVDESVLRTYCDLIADSQDIHASELEDRKKNNQPPTEYTASRPGENKPEIAAMSRHSYDAAAGAVEGSTFCYGNVEMKGGKYIVNALYPVMVSRKLYEKSPLDCLPESLRPATSIEDLSPADRVFGWVNQDEKTAEGEANSAYRSHLRVGPVACVTGQAIETFDPPKTLAILAEPKPAQGRFYLGDNEGKAQPRGRTKREAGYTDPNRIRGPKIYPHHANVNWNDNEVERDAYSRDALRRAFSEDPSKQNRSIKGWVKQDTVFEFDIHVTNLTTLELGALLWLVSLPKEHFFRLGLGKPLGFGSVRIERSPDGSVIADGANWIEAIADCEGPEKLDEDTIGKMIQVFEQTMETANPALLSAFQRAASGFGDLPIHYPSIEGQKASSGEHFQWFVANEKKEHRQSLPDLHDKHVSLQKWTK